MATKSQAPSPVRQYDSGGTADGELPLPPGMDARWFAREGVNVLLNGGVTHAEQLFQKFRQCSPLLASGASLVDFITAAMTFEDEKMDLAYNSLKSTIKMCDVDSLFEGVIYKRPSERWTTVERIERMIIWADCELFLAFLMFLKQSVVDFVKAGYHMRRAWKMYEKCYKEIHGVEILLNGTVQKKKKKDVPLSKNISEDEALILDASLSFGYGLIQVAISIVPAALLKVCELFGFQGDREVGLDALKLAGQSQDMKAPIARLTLLWYHTVVRPFCALDSDATQSGLDEASSILAESEKEFPTSAIFLYFKALIFRSRGSIDDALKVLAQTMEVSKEQREIALLCFYDKGWCHLMKLEWEKASQCFIELRNQSKWSEAYYVYLLAVTKGSQGQVNEAHEYLKSIPKLVVRKTQLESYLGRKSSVYKKRCPERMEYALLGIELLYLWNTLPQCSSETLEDMLEELRACELVVLQPLKQLLVGSIHAVLGNTGIALEHLTKASAKPETKVFEPHVVPYALYEIAMIHVQKDKNYTKGREVLYRIKESCSNYDFENRLNFRIHAALNNIEDMQQIQISQLKLTPDPPPANCKQP